MGGDGENLGEIQTGVIGEITELSDMVLREYSSRKKKRSRYKCEVWPNTYFAM